MKKYFYVMLAIISFPFISQAQWQTDVRLTNDPGQSSTSENNAWCVASNGDFVHVAWFDNRDGNYEIYYKRSTDGGLSWGIDIRLTNNSLASQIPSVSVLGQVVHVVWRDTRDGNQEIYYKRSADGGASWSADLRLTDNSSFSTSPTVSVSGQIVHVVWEDFRDGNFEIYHKRSTDGGASWGAESRLTNASGYSSLPSVSVSDQVLHVVWLDIRDVTIGIYYKRSTDAGVSWGADLRLTDISGGSSHPSVTVSGQIVHVACHDSRDGNLEIYYKRSTDGGTSWEADTRLTNDAGESRSPSISVSGQFVLGTWHDNRDGTQEIYYKRSSNGGISWGADTRLTNATADSRYSSISVSGQVAHVVWQDQRDGNWEIYYKRDPTANVVGMTNIHSEIPKEFKLEQNYPNPFNPTTKIGFALPRGSTAELVIYDVLGNKLETLVNQYLNAGTYETNWNATKYSSGVYFYKLKTDEYLEIKKMVIIK